MSYTKPYAHIRVALAEPAIVGNYTPPATPSAGAIYHGFCDSSELTAEQYRALQAKETCKHCGREFTYTAEAPTNGRDYYCSQLHHDMDNAPLNVRTLKGETYGGIDV